MYVDNSEQAILKQEYDNACTYVPTKLHIS